MRTRLRFCLVLSPSCTAEDSRSGKRFQVFLKCRGPRLQLASSSFSLRTRRCEQKEVPDQLTLRVSRSVAKPTKPSLDELRRYASEVEAVPQFFHWHIISAADTVIAKDCQQPFVDHSHWPKFAIVHRVALRLSDALFFPTFCDIS